MRTVLDGTSRRPRGATPGRRFRRLFAVPALLLALPWLVAWSFFDPFHQNVEEGNEKAEEGGSEEALSHYDEAARVNPSSPIPDFNRGLVLSGDDPTQAMDAFRAAAASQDPSVAADALYNLGNVHLEGEEFEPAIESFLKSLDLDPTDGDARRNLEIALERLREQEQQPQDQEQNQDEKQDEKQEEQPQEPEDDPNHEEQPQPEDDPEEEQPPPEPQRQEERLSREDAERLLNAVQSEELKTLEELQQQEVQEGVVTHDW